MKKNQATGHWHPISRAILDIRGIFAELDFEVASGPELEDDWHNFDALNVPKNHPSRDMQDTFWLKPAKGGFARPDLQSKSGLGLNSHTLLLRTHTSPVQIRYMEQKIKEGIKA